MYIKDDVCHAGELTEGIKVDAAKLLRGGMLLVTFSAGEKRLFDSTKLEGAAFAPLADERVLGDFEIFHGVMTWLNGEIDIAPKPCTATATPIPKKPPSRGAGNRPLGGWDTSTWPPPHDAQVPGTDVSSGDRSPSVSSNLRTFIRIIVVQWLQTISAGGQHIRFGHPRIQAP